jgi:uncharacterized protein YoaH (UPF0181 family)
MCPACMASAGMVVAGAVSTGGVSALVAKVLRKKKKTQDVDPRAKEH